MEEKGIVAVFENAFCEVSDRISSIKLQREENLANTDCKDMLEKGYREMIHIHGFMDAVLVCNFTDELFRQIVCAMNGEVMPEEEEVPLYLNEYINIICGYAVSRLNTIIGQKSRVSVPSFLDKEDYLEISMEHKERLVMCFDSPYGLLQTVLYYRMSDIENR